MGTKLNFRKRLFRLIFGETILSSLTQGNPYVPEGSGLNDKYLFDFKNYSSQYNNNVPTAVMSNDHSSEGTSPKKIAIKPIDVLGELEVIPTPFTLTLLDEKIDMLLEKEKIIVQEYSKRDIIYLIERLNNRKKYQEHKVFFDSFQNTTDEKIEKILDKYDLVMRTSDIFVPEFPDDAIKTMTQYIDKVVEVSGKKPIFYVIATPENFQEKYKKRDPILLAQSPFGFYWQILGAWDKEMVLLSEL